MVGVKNNLVVDEVSLNQSECEIVAVRIAIQNTSPLYVAAYYRPPDEHIAKLDKFEEAMGQLLERTNGNSKATLLIGGDFNVGDIDWEKGIVNENSTKKSVCGRVLDIINGAHLTQLQKDPTRQDKVLDLLCTSNPSLLKSIETVPGISDHDGIAVADFYLRAHVNKKAPIPSHSGPGQTGVLCAKILRDSAGYTWKELRLEASSRTGRTLRPT